VVGVDSVKNELVVGIVGELPTGVPLFAWTVVEWTRLREDLYVGQKVGELG